MTLLCVAIITSMVDLTTAHIIIRFTKTVIGWSAQFASCGTVANIAFRLNTWDKVSVGRTRCSFSASECNAVCIT